VRLHCHSAPKPELATACGRAAIALPATVKRSAMTPSILDLRQMNSISHSSGFDAMTCICGSTIIAPSCNGFTIFQLGGTVS
jgi:hypothetical protein